MPARKEPIICVTADPEKFSIQVPPRDFNFMDNYCVALACVQILDVAGDIDEDQPTIDIRAQMEMKYEGKEFL